ncbi:hypothetical protein BZM27_48095 [Paraburkholderia steynii]|uniref:TEP-1 C-terminal beta-propeller domain-containing protein n=1 Tax=Paraburkholderia steynii TaxID=1245441 RepID=A0A4R0X0Y2_9BURK|nr:hypothetical protein BZM27_48095 [Paraburkholderia steynii]
MLSDGRIASGTLADNAIRLWNPASGSARRRSKDDGATHAFAVLADGRLASGSWDNTIRLWNPANGMCEATLEGHSETVSALAVLSDGRIVSGSRDRTIRVWQVSDGRWTGMVRFVADAGIEAVVFTARAGVLAAGDGSGRVHFLKVEAAGTFPE